jgi:hypothetical protein
MSMEQWWNDSDETEVYLLPLSFSGTEQWIFLYESDTYGSTWLGLEITPDALKTIVNLNYI